MGEITQTPVEDAAALLALALTPGIGQHSVRLALETAGRLHLPPYAFLVLPLRRLVAALPPRSDAVAARIAEQTPAWHARALRLLEQLLESGGGYVSLSDTAYPRRVRAHLRRAAPPLLFFRGPLELLARPGTAVVGTRTPLPGARDAASSMARFAAMAGDILISGAAEGIDTTAHNAALAAGGTTLAVLPQGVLTYTPPPYLEQALREGRALLLSPFPPDAPWRRYAAVTRNDLIAAAARLILVVAPQKTGGSVRTGLSGRGQGKTVAVWQHPPDALPRTLLGAGCADLGAAQGLELAQQLHGLWRQAQALDAGSPDLWE